MWLLEVFYLEDPCELTFANTLFCLFFCAEISSVPSSLYSRYMSIARLEFSLGSFVILYWVFPFAPPQLRFPRPGLLEVAEAFPLAVRVGAHTDIGRWSSAHLAIDAEGIVESCVTPMFKE